MSATKFDGNIEILFNCYLSIAFPPFKCLHENSDVQLFLRRSNNSGDTLLAVTKGSCRVLMHAWNGQPYTIMKHPDSWSRTNCLKETNQCDGSTGKMTETNRTRTGQFDALVPAASALHTHYSSTCVCCFIFGELFYR